MKTRWTPFEPELRPKVRSTLLSDIFTEGALFRDSAFSIKRSHFNGLFSFQIHSECFDSEPKKFDSDVIEE